MGYNSFERSIFANAAACGTERGLPGQGLRKRIGAAIPCREIGEAAATIGRLWGPSRRPAGYMTEDDTLEKAPAS